MSYAPFKPVRSVFLCVAPVFSGSDALPQILVHQPGETTCVAVEEEAHVADLVGCALQRIDGFDILSEAGFERAQLTAHGQVFLGRFEVTLAQQVAIAGSIDQTCHEGDNSGCSESPDKQTTALVAVRHPPPNTTP